MRRAGVVWLGHTTIAKLLRLPEGQRVGAIHADWLRLGIGVTVEGDGLPEVAEMSEPVRLDPSGYVDLDLRAKIEALVQRAEMLDADAEMVRQVLAGKLDPRVDMPEELRT
jgi:hypothetical protein